MNLGNAMDSVTGSFDVETVAPGVTSLIQQTAAPGEQWYDALARILPSIAATYQQREILQIQVERARQGLPPIDASAYGVGVNVGLSPSTQKLLMYGGLAAIGYLVLSQVLTRR